MCTQAGNAAPHNPANGAHFHNFLPRSLLFFATDFHPPGLGLSSSTPDLPQGCLKGLQWPSATEGSKLLSSEQHPMTWSRSQCAQASCWVSCPCSPLLHPDLPGYQAPRRWGNAGTSGYFPTHLHSSFSPAEAVLLVHIHKCCDLFDAQTGTFTHLLHVVNLKSGVYI